MVRKILRFLYELSGKFYITDATNIIANILQVIAPFFVSVFELFLCLHHQHRTGQVLGNSRVHARARMHPFSLIKQSIEPILLQRT